MDSKIKTKTKTTVKSVFDKPNKKVHIVENKKSIWDEFQKDEKSFSTSYLLNNHYSTPQPVKLPKPSQKAFFSDGYESKKKKTRQSYQHTPKTPSKQYTLNSFSDVNLLTPTPNRSLKFTENSFSSDSSCSFSSPSSPTKSRSKIERLFSPNSDSSLSPPLPFGQNQFTINQNFDDPQSPIPTHKISYKNTSRILDKEYVEYICNSHTEKEIPKKALQDDYLGNNFVDRHVIGCGSFAIVYKVKDLKDDKYYAVKVSKDPFHGEKDRINQLEEVNIWWKIGNNDNCVQLHQAWEQDGILHLQLDLCDGGSLQDYLETTGSQSTLPESQIWKILLDICKGLEHVHSLNIVHLDIKPANIFIKKSKDGELILKIGDFGLARKCPVPPNTGLEGDKVYLAPEVLGDDGFETSADIFSLGLILVEMASNTYLPDTGVYWQDLRKGNISLCENLNHASDELLNLIKKMIDPNPKLRPTASDIMKIAKEQINKYGDSVTLMNPDILNDLPSSSTSSSSLTLSSSSSFSYTLSSSSSFIEEEDNDIEIIDNIKLPNTKEIVNKRSEEDDDEKSKDKDLFNSKPKRKKILNINEFLMKPPNLNEISTTSRNSRTKRNSKSTITKRRVRKSSTSHSLPSGPTQTSLLAATTKINNNDTTTSTTSLKPKVVATATVPTTDTDTNANVNANINTNTISAISSNDKENTINSSSINILTSLNTKHQKTQNSGQQTLISDHFIPKKNDGNIIKTTTNLNIPSSPNSNLNSNNTNDNNHSIINTSSNNRINSSNSNNVNSNSNTNNGINNLSTNTSELQEVSLYYKQEKLSERRKTINHIPKKDSKKVVILDIGKGISKVKGNNKKRVKWKEWNKIIEFKDDSLNKEILFCNED